MSLYGSLFSGVSGLSAQSSAMGAISDNVANINTIGYKGTETQFQTLVTKQVSSTKYSPGGVQSKPQAGIDVQGLLSSTSNATDLGISGDGFFVVNQAANPSSGDTWGYTRAGSFQLDDDGYLTNTAGYYLQGWTLQPHDGEPTAATVNVGGISYMKAYQRADASTYYINDNIIDSENLQPINLNTIGGSATPTKQIRMGANLPADEPVFDAANPEAGGQHGLAVLIYDSLGNAHNINFNYRKESSNSWSVDAEMPSGAANLVVYSDRETTVDGGDEVYSARGQLEFETIPANHSNIKITHERGNPEEKTYVFEFTNDGTTTYTAGPNEQVVPVDISTGVVAVSDAVELLEARIQENLPSGQRFSQDGNTIEILQSTGGAPLTMDASDCLQCKQASANPNPITGISTGVFDVPEIDWEIKNTGRIDFNSTDPDDYSDVGGGANRSITIGKNTYEFVRTGSVAVASGNIAVNIDSAISGGEVDPSSVVSLLAGSLTSNSEEPDRYHASGRSLEINQSETGNDVMLNTTDNERINLLSNTLADYDGLTLTLSDGRTYELDNDAAFTGGNVQVDISGITDGVGTTAIDVMNALKSVINNTNIAAGTPDYGSQLTVNGASLLSADSVITGGTLDATIAGVTEQFVVDGLNTGGADVITGEIKNNGTGSSPVSLAGGPAVIADAFEFNGQPDAESGSKAAGIRFNSDGTPKYFNVDRMSIEWSNGSEDMVGTADEGDIVELFMGNPATSDGMTHLSGAFIPNYIKQDGSKFGNFAGISTGKDGVVTALFDNGETRPIAQIPLATFVNANGMESLTGNAWIETDYSGQPTLRQAGDGGAGTVNAASLESSTVDLGEEFTNMITVQRAYSAAAKIITTADDMLSELMNVKR